MSLLAVTRVHQLHQLHQLLNGFSLDPCSLDAFSLDAFSLNVFSLNVFFAASAALSFLWRLPNKGVDLYNLLPVIRAWKRRPTPETLRTRHNA